MGETKRFELQANMFSRTALCLLASLPLATPLSAGVVEADLNPSQFREFNSSSNSSVSEPLDAEFSQPLLEGDRPRKRPRKKPSRKPMSESKKSKDDRIVGTQDTGIIGTNGKQTPNSHPSGIITTNGQLLEEEDRPRKNRKKSPQASTKTSKVKIGLGDLAKQDDRIAGTQDTGIIGTNGKQSPNSHPSGIITTNGQLLEEEDPPRKNRKKSQQASEQTSKVNNGLGDFARPRRKAAN